jgi:hypothetical protein
MASLPTLAEQQMHELDSEGVDLDPAVAGQLIEQTVSLAIPGLGSEAEEFPVPGNDTSCQLETTHSPVPPSCTGARPYLDMMPGEQAVDAAAKVVLLSSSVAEVLSRGAQSEDAGSRGVVRQPISPRELLDLPNEVLLHILSYLEVCDLLATSRVRPTFRFPVPVDFHATMSRMPSLEPP